MAAWEGIEMATQKKKKKENKLLHCEPEMDLMHRLQSIHITLLGKNITPDEIQQLTSSSQSQCRVVPAPQEPPSGSCQQQGWCSQPGPLTPVHPQSPWPLLCRMGFGRWALRNPATTPGGVFFQPSAPAHCHKLLPRSRADRELQPWQPKTRRPDPNCKGADVCQTEKHTLSCFSCLSSKHESHL